MTGNDVETGQHWDTVMLPPLLGLAEPLIPLTAIVVSVARLGLLLKTGCVVIVPRLTLFRAVLEVIAMLSVEFKTKLVPG
jgi:hypothetical protein